MAFYTSFLVNLILERPARRLTMTEFAVRLQRSGEKIERHLDAVSETVRNRIVLRHLIGIERWGQRRLRVALAEPLVLDEYDSYRPDKDTAWGDMKDLFSSTRNETIAIARKLESVVMPDMTIPHNTYGNLTLRAWLRFLDIHASWETRKIR